MITVVLVGTGNVAQNLFQGFAKASDISVIQVVGRDIGHLNFAKDTAQVTTDLTQILPSDIYILAISDDAIKLVSKALKHLNGLVVHTSGGTSMEALDNQKSYGVFYPVQTFTKGKIVPFDNIPICIEASNDKGLELLQELGGSLSKKVVRLNSEERSILHVAAVFVNNFTNYMYTVGADICDDNKVDFNLLKPLIQETATKINDQSPLEAQTGPAKRGDQKTLHTHLTILKKRHERELYTLLSNAIKNKHGEKL